MLLTVQQIRDANDIQPITVEVPEWGGEVLIAPLSAEVAEVVAKSDGGDNFGLWAAVSIVDENGKRLFSDDDVPMLSKKSFVALKRITEAAMEINGMTAEAVNELGKD